MHFITFDNLQNSLKSRLKIREMAFQRLWILKFSGGTWTLTPLESRPPYFSKDSVGPHCLRSVLYYMFLSHEGPTLDTFDHTLRIGSTPTFLYFDLYLYTLPRQQTTFISTFIQPFHILICIWTLSTQHITFISSLKARVISLALIDIILRNWKETIVISC